MHSSNCKNLTDITIPNSVTRIGASTFYNCDSLTNVIIPNSVTFIGPEAFGNCDKLASVTIPKSVTSINVGAFRYCDGLTDVYYGGNETQWGQITISFNNDPLLNATIHFGSYYL